MKQQVFYIHGADALTHYEDYLAYLRKIDITDLPWAEEAPKRWSKTLREDLGGEYVVFAPAMPNKLNAHYEEWKIWFERHFEYLQDDIILVGWSMGAYFFTKYLIENEFPFTVKALFLIAGPFENTDSGDGEDGGDFAFDTTRVGELAGKAGQIFILHSEDDFVVPYAHALKYKSALPNAELLTFTDRNHFLQAEFPELVASIRAL